MEGTLCQFFAKNALMLHRNYPEASSAVSDLNDTFAISTLSISKSFSQASQTTTRVLVTGGCGFLGGHIVKQLLDGNETYVAILSRNQKPTFNDPRISYYAAEITSQSQIQEIFDQFEPHAVIHTVSPYYLASASELNRINVDGTKILLELAQSCSDTRVFVYTSSASAVWPTRTPLTEENAELLTSTSFDTRYGMSKGVAEAVVLGANSDGLRTSVIRLPSLYGEAIGDSMTRTNFIAQLVAGMRKGNQRMQVGMDEKLFDFTYVKKAAEAHILAMKALLSDQSTRSVGGEAFFITDGKSEGFFSFARKCYAAAGNPVRPEEVTIIPMKVMQYIASGTEWLYWIFTLGTKNPEVRREDIHHLDRGSCWNIEKARKLLGYEPIEDQALAIQQTMGWAMSKL